jgi:hypothetical protein
MWRSPSEVLRAPLLAVVMWLCVGHLLVEWTAGMRAPANETLKVEKASIVCQPAVLQLTEKPNEFFYFYKYEKKNPVLYYKKFNPAFARIPAGHVTSAEACHITFTLTDVSECSINFL